MLIINAVTNDLSPPLKWAGGKRWLMPKLASLWQSQAGHRLVEPFVGGGAVALGLRPRQALLNDINPHLVNFYRWLRRGLRLALPMFNERQLYYQHRERFNQLISNDGSQSAEAAALFYYLNRTGYNGLCRFNGKGFFNVPFGRHASINYVADFARYKSVLANWRFSVGDFSEVRIDPDDFIYADPPYDVEFTAYSPGGFSWDDQRRLAVWLAAHKGPVVVSNQATARIIDLYRNLNFDLEILEAPRMISRTGDRTRAREMLATKGM